MIEHTTYAVKASVFGNNNSLAMWKNFLNAIQSAYTWGDKTSVVESSSASYPQAYKETYGKYYFSENSYFSLDMYAKNSAYLGINIAVPSGTKRVEFNAEYCTLSIGKTSKGVCICAYSGEKANTRDPHFYNLYAGEIALLDGTTTKGCIYVADDNSYVVATDNGISEEATFNSIIDGTRKGYLIPVTDSTFGGTFKDIYMMACAPIQFNKMKVADKKYLCGKAFCLADE
jgi:hypothetical protein